ncbi:PQQ-binding-like beta-propeller repeat protein [Micromonospora eburnea]|uniref:outer membrane protein assembly factor BamB family protein n=1 Tax=Micromonospora eburnea TaxID=227316 RepID=UPI001428CAE3|nr:PQQ-binding-like beta-propeller repeat protein [Micromonospora eburnea]
MTVIDLGELRDDSAPDRPARPPRAVGRPYRCVAVLLAALVTLAGAAPAPRRIAATVPGGPGAAAFVVDDRVYVVEPADPERGTGRRLVAYRVTAYRPRALWQSPLPGGGIVELARMVDGRLLLTGRTTNDAGWETTALDATTGRLGWRRPGAAFLAGDVVFLYTSDGDGADETRRIDARTGETLWSMPTTSADLNLSRGPAGVERVVLAHDSGLTEVFDAASGVRLVARDLRTGEPPFRGRAVVVDGLLLVIDAAGGTVTGYDLDRLDPHWNVPLPSVDYAERCGRSLCLYRQDGGVWVVDPATGATRWSDRRWVAATAAADGLLLVAELAPAASSVLAVVEEATGRLVAEFGEWQVVPRGDEDGPMIGVRPDGDGRLLVAELDPAVGQARIRDALPGVLVADCRAGALLVCHRTDGSLVLWWNR